MADLLVDAVGPTVPLVEVRLSDRCVYVHGAMAHGDTVKHDDSVKVASDSVQRVDYWQGDDELVFYVDVFVCANNCQAVRIGIAIRSRVVGGSGSAAVGDTRIVNRVVLCGSLYGQSARVRCHSVILSLCAVPRTS